MVQFAAADQIIQNMPELSHVLNWDETGASRERVERAASLVTEAEKLYGTQTGRYKWALRLGGKTHFGDQRVRAELVGAGMLLITGLFGLGMAVNMISRSIYYKSFAHIKAWGKCYLKILAVPPALGIATLLTQNWADNRLKDVRDKLHQDKWKNLTSEEVFKAGLYELMDREQFVLAHTLKGLCIAEWAKLSKQVRQGGNIDQIEQQVDRAQKKIREAAKAAYTEGCYRIHCAHLSAKNEAPPPRASFQLPDMRMPY